MASYKDLLQDLDLDFPALVLHKAQHQDHRHNNNYRNKGRTARFLRLGLALRDQGAGPLHEILEALMGNTSILQWQTRMKRSEAPQWSRP